jgi:hypothetical protein
MKRFGILAIGLTAGILAGCGTDLPLDLHGSPLAGLDQTAANDSSVVGDSTFGSGPGFFRGTVMGPSTPRQGNDSLATAPRIPGVVVTIYVKKPGHVDTVAVGDAKGSVTTGADGKFTLPTLPAGEYIITFVPPANSGYHGAYAFGPLREHSGDYPWWVVLAKK